MESMTNPTETAVRHWLLKIIACAGLLSILLQPSSASVYILALGLFLPSALCVTLGGGRGVLFAFILLLFFFCSHCRYLLRTENKLPFPREAIGLIEARLLAEPSWDARGNVRVSTSLVKAVSLRGCEAEASGECTVILAADICTAPEDWFRGDVLRIRGRMGESRVRGDHRFYGRRILCLRRFRPSSMRIRIHRYIREGSVRLGGHSTVLLPALVLGQRDPRLEDTAVLFRETGTAHIIALSGFHSGLVAFLLFLAFRPAAGYRIALLISAAGLLFYLYLAGPKPSLMRAVLMYALIIGGRLRFRRIEMKRVLWASFFITALLVPESLHTLSARLSYLALWGILDGAALFSSLMERRLPPILTLPLAAGLAAQLWTFPLVVFSFGLWYPAGIPASLVLTPLVSLYMYAGILYLIIPPLLSPPFVLLCRLLEQLLTGTAWLFRKLPPLILEPGPGVFLFLLFPLLLGLTYRPGGFNGERKPGSQLRFGFRDKGSPRYDGAGAPQALGAELSDQPGSQRENYKTAGSTGG